MARFRALVLLGWHFILHWLSKLFFLYRRGGIERFRANYDADHLLPIATEDRPSMPDWQGCIGCGLCDALCPATPAILRHAGATPQFLMTAGSRDTSALVAAREEVTALLGCDACKACEDACPAGVPIRDVLGWIHRDVERLG